MHDQNWTVLDLCVEIRIMDVLTNLSFQFFYIHLSLLRVEANMCNRTYYKFIMIVTKLHISSIHIDITNRLRLQMEWVWSYGTLMEWSYYGWFYTFTDTYTNSIEIHSTNNICINFLIRNYYFHPENINTPNRIGLFIYTQILCKGYILFI